MNAFRGGAVGFIDWLDVLCATKCMLSDAASACQVKEEPDETPLESTEQNRGECEHVTRRVVDEWDVGEKNREVDERHHEPAHVSLDVPSREHPTNVKCDYDKRVNGKQQTRYGPASDDCANAHDI